MVNTHHLLHAPPDPTATHTQAQSLSSYFNMPNPTVLSFQTYTAVTSNPFTVTRSKMSITVIKENYRTQFDWHNCPSCDYTADGQQIQCWAKIWPETCSKCLRKLTTRDSNLGRDCGTSLYHHIHNAARTLPITPYFKTPFHLLISRGVKSHMT